MIIGDLSPLLNSAIVGTLSLGGLFALIGLGFTVIYRTTRVVNFAQGEFLALGAFIASTLLASGIRNHAFAIVLAVVIDAILGVVVYYVIIRRLVGKDEFAIIILTFGIAIILDSAIALIWGSDTRFISIGVSTSTFTILGVRLTALQLAAVGVAVVGAAAILIVMRFTRWGVDSRALAENPELATYFGVNTDIVASIAWAFGIGVAALAGIVYGASTTVSLSLTDIGLIALPGILLGGMDSVGGSIVGGLIMGGAITAVTYVGGPELATIAGYGLLILVLVFLPQGLFGIRRARIV
jgi:branched-chain amino acid transport system permease protein